MNPCRRCDADQTDAASLCFTCADKTSAALREIALTLPQLRFTAAGQGVDSGPTGRISGTGHSDGISVHALDVLAEVRGVVAGWLRVMLEEQVITTMPERLDNGFVDTAALCRHLAGRMVLVRLTEVGADVAADVLDSDVPSICLALEGSSARPPLLSLVRQVVDTHRGGDGLPESLQARAQAVCDEWWPLNDVAEILPKLMPDGRRPPTLRTLQRWAYGTPATKGREAQPARLMVSEGLVRVGSVINLATGVSEAA